MLGGLLSTLVSYRLVHQYTTGFIAAGGPLATIVLFALAFWCLAVRGRRYRAITRAVESAADDEAAREKPIMFSVYLDRITGEEEGEGEEEMDMPFRGDSRDLVKMQVKPAIRASPYLHILTQNQPMSAAIIALPSSSQTPDLESSQSGQESSAEPSRSRLLARTYLARKKHPTAASPASKKTNAEGRICVSIMIAMPRNQRGRRDPMEGAWADAPLPDVVVGSTEFRWKDVGLSREEESP